MCALSSCRNLGLVLIIITLNANLPFGCAQSYDEPYIVKPTPALRLNDGDDLTTVLLVNNNGQGRLGDNHGRFLSVRPEVGLLTSTARTFIQGGITTEYATQVVGTTLNNGRLYAQYLKKSSRVLFENGHVAPSVITSWVGAGEQTSTRSYLQSHNDLLNAEAPDWQDIDDSLIGSLTKKDEFVGNTDYLKLKNANTQTLKVSVSPALATKDVATELTAFKLANRSKFSEENARILAAHKVLPIGDLPTITVKNHFEPSGYQSIEHSDNDNGIRINTEEERTAKLYYQQLLKQKKQSEPLNSAPKRVFSTVTYYGFAEFTTIVGDSVIVFSPSTAQAKPVVGHLTTLKGMATISENIKTATEISTQIEATSILSTIQALATAISLEDSSSSEVIDAASSKKIDSPISPSKQIVLAASPSLDTTTEQVVTPQATLNETKPMFSLPTDQEILAIYASLSKAQAQAGIGVEATSTEAPAPKSVSSESHLQVHGGATTIFVDDDPFANFVEPTMVTQVTGKSTITTTDVNFETSSEELTTINNTESSEETTTQSLGDESNPTTLDSTTEIEESETVQSIEANKDDNLDVCSDKRSQVITLTQLPKTLTVLKTHILDNRKESSIETSMVTTYDTQETTKYYCIEATQIMESPQLERAIIPDSTMKLSDSGMQTESKFEFESDSDDETTTMEFLTKISHSEPEPNEKSEDNYVTESDSEDDYDIDNDSKEYDIIYKTLYTTYTYLTTFFQGESTTVSSHTEIISNVITSTLASDQDEGTTLIQNPSTEQTISIAPTVSTTYQTKYMIPEELESLIHVSEDIISKDDVQKTSQLDDSSYVKTFYTTYTYYTTIFADSDTDVMSRTEVFTNYVTELAPSIKTEATEVITASSTEQAKSKVVELVTSSASNFLLESSLPTAVREQAESVTLITDVRSSSSSGGQEVIGNSKESIDDQVSSESNTEEILPSATLLLQTSFTTFTFYTTMYAVNSTNVVSRLETVTNIATETLQPTKMLSQEDGTLPITYFTTFTYWTKLAKDGEINTISREETVSNVIEPTNRIPIETNENLNTLLSTETSVNDTILTSVNDLPDPTTYYTTYTYYTTSYEANKTFTASRFETVTNVVTPTEETAVVVATKPIESHTEEPATNINSSSVINIDKKPILLFYDYKQIIDADEVSTLYFTTEVQKSVNDEGQPIELTSSTSSLYIDETKKSNLATSTESLLSSRQYKTGLVRLIEGTRIGNSTTTLYQSKVIGTIIDNRYAQIIESTSSFLFENAIPLATVAPTETLDDNIERTKLVELSQTPAIVESSVNSDEDAEDNISTASNAPSPNPSKKKTFAPVIRPFASRNRPTFAPKQKTLSASSATIITRSDITPTITATPALKTPGRYSSSRRVGSNVPNNPNNPNLIIQSTSRRLFGRPIKPSSTTAVGGSSFSGSTGYASTRNRFASSSRATPVSSSKRLNINPSFRSTSLNFRASVGQRIRPSVALGQSALTSATSTIAPARSDSTDLEEESSTEDQVQQSEEEEVTTENSRRNQNPLLRFRRPLNRPSGFTPIPRANTPPVTISPRRNPLSGRVKAQTTTTTTTTTTPKSKARTFQRPTLSSLQSRTRSPNNIFPPRGLFQRQQTTSEISELNSNDKSTENNSEYDDSDDGEEGEDSEQQNESDRRRRSSQKKAENIIILKRHRRQVDSLKNRFRFRRPTTATTEDPAITQSSEDLSETPSTLKIHTRFGSRYQASAHHRPQKVTQNTASTSSLRSNIRPTRPTSPRAQFTLRDKDVNSKSNARAVGTTSNFRRPPTNSRRNQAVTNNGLATSRRLKSYNNNVDSSIGRSISSSGNSARSRNSNTSARGRGTTRSRGRNDYNQDISASELENLTITVTHVIPTEIALPVVNGHQTEYKNIVTGKTSLETLGPHQYSHSLGHNGLTSIFLTREDSSINQAGNTELTKYLLHDSATTTVTFTPTTIRGRKTSFSHVLPSTAYSVENVVSTVQAQISGNAPLANILLSQLLLGNINLPSNPLLGALGQAQVMEAALEPSKPLLPVTEYRTHTSTYVTTIYDGKSTIVPLTFQGKKILTTVFDTTAQTITATEYSVDTIINTPTMQHQQQHQVAQVNSLLLQQLLLQQQQQQQPSISQITQTTSAQIFTENLQDLNDVPRFDVNVNDDIIAPTNEPTQPKSNRKKPRKSHKSHKRNKTKPVVEESSVITLYVSGRRPGEFSTILSTVQISSDASVSLQKRQAYAEIQPTDIYNDPADFYDQEGSERLEFFIPLAPEKDMQDVGQIDANESKDSTELLETIIGDVDLWYAKSTKQPHKATTSKASYKAITRSIPSDTNIRLLDEYEKHLGNISKLSADEARFNLATHVMSNGVELIIASDKIKHTEKPEHNSSSAAPKHGQQKIVTLAPSTLKNQMLLALPSDKRENFTIPVDDNQFITKNCLTTYTYRTTYIENGTATVESREKVVSNRHTEERNYLKRTTQLPVGVTLSNTPDLVKGVFPTTYHYYNTLAGNDFVLTSRYTIINTITGPVDYISFLQPSEEATPLLETNTYYSRLTLTKSIQDGNDETRRVVLNENMLTQVVITESLPARSSMRSSKMRISATNKINTKSELNVHVYATKTILTTLKYSSSTALATTLLDQHEQEAQGSSEIQTRIIKTIISDVVPTTLLKPKLVSLFRNSNRKVLVTLATLADGETLQVTAVNLAQTDSSIPNLGNSLLTNFIQPTSVSNNNNILMKTKRVEDNNFEESENKVVYSKPAKEPTSSASTVDQLIDSFNLQRFQPVFNVMADLFQKNMLNKQAAQLKHHDIVQSVATIKPDTANKNNPLYIPLQDGSNVYNDNKPEYNISLANDLNSNLGRLTAHSLHIQPPLANLSDLVMDQHTNIPLSQQNMVLGNGIPIRPGEIINANANLIIGRPNGIVGQYFQSTNSDQSWEEYKNRSENISKKKTFPPNISLALMPPRIIPLGGASYYDQERIRAAYFEKERIPTNSMAVNIYNNILKPPKSDTNYSSMSTHYIRETSPAATLPIKGPVSTLTDTELKPPVQLYVNNYYNQLYSSPPIEPPPAIYTDTLLRYSLAPPSTVLNGTSGPLLNPPPAPLIKSDVYNEQYSSAPMDQPSSFYPETSLGSHMDPPLMINLNDAERKPPAISSVSGIYKPFYNSAPMNPPTSVHTETQLMPPALLNLPGHYNQQITRLNSELDKNKILEIRKIPQIFSTKLPAITQYTTFESTTDYRMPLRILIPTTYPAHHQINLKTDVLSHNVNINAPPLTFKRENFPLAAAIRGHIAPTQMPQVKIPANRANIEVRLSPLNTRMSVVRDFDKQLKDIWTNQQHTFTKLQDNFHHKNPYTDSIYQEQKQNNNFEKESFLESKTKDWNSHSLITAFKALPKPNESKNPNYKESMPNDLSKSIYEALPLNKLNKEKTYVPQDQRAEYTQNNLNIIRNQKLTDYLILNKSHNKFDFMQAQPFRLPSHDLNHKTSDPYKNDRPKKLFVASGERFLHKIEPTMNGLKGTLAFSQNNPHVGSAFSMKINETYPKFYATTTLLNVSTNTVVYTSALKSSHVNLLKTISSSKTDQLKPLATNIFIFKTSRVSTTKTPLSISNKQIITSTTSTTVRHTQASKKTNSTLKTHWKNTLSSKLHSLQNTPLYLPHLQSELNSSLITQPSQKRLFSKLSTTKTSITMSSILAMMPNSNNANNFNNAINESQLYQSVIYTHPTLESSEVLVKTQLTLGEMSNNRITDLLDDSTLSTIMQSVLCTDNSLSCALNSESSKRTPSVTSVFMLKPSIPIVSKSSNANVLKNKTKARDSLGALADFEHSHEKSAHSKLKPTITNIDRTLNTHLWTNETIKHKIDILKTFAYFDHNNVESFQSKTRTSTHLLKSTITIVDKTITANVSKSKTFEKDISNISAGYTDRIKLRSTTKAYILKPTITIDDRTLSSKVDTDVSYISNQESSNVIDLENDSNLANDKVTRDEQFVPPLNSNSVFLGGVLTAGPAKPDYIENSPILNSTDMSVCYPACKSKLNEICINLPNIGKSCECRSGFARLFPDRPCKPTYTFELRLPTSRVGNYPLKHNNDYNNNLSSQYRYLSSIVLDAIDRMVMQSDFRDIYYGVQLREFNMDLNGALIGNFLLQLSENCAEKRLESVFRKYLRLSNFSIGGTELYTTKDRLNALTIHDFDECGSVGFNDCSSLAQCFNLAGSYTCSCRDGFADISDNPIYPGRLCSDQLIGCGKCNYHGNCMLPISNTNNSLEGETVQHFCECFAWYTGYNCQLNLKILLICLIAIGILFVLLLACMFLIYTSRKNRTRTNFITAFNYHPSTLTTNSIRKCSLEKNAILNDLHSESSHSSDQNLYKDSIDLVQKENSGNILYKLKQIPMDRKHAIFDKQFESLQSLVNQSSHSRIQDNNDVEQTDRSLTVMIPRAKYYHPTVLPVLPVRQNFDRIDTLNQSNEATQFYTTLTDKVKEDNWISKDYRCSNNGALVSAGFEVSAIVNEAPIELKDTTTNLDPTNGRQQIACTNLEAILRSVESTDVRSFDETTIQPATKSIRSCFDMQRTSIINEDVNMTERDMGFTFLLPHTHLYKPEKTKSDLSGFDSV